MVEELQDLALDTVVIQPRHQDQGGIDLRPGAGPLRQPELISKERDSALSAGFEVSRGQLTYRERLELQADNKGSVTLPVLPFTKHEPVKATASEIPEDASWGIDAVGALAWDENAGRGVRVAVLDTGIDELHPAFVGVKIDFKNYTLEGNEDTEGHGTHCTGTILGRDVDGVRIGVARGVQELFAAKVLGDGGGDSQSIFSALNDVQSWGAHIVSMSLGIDFPKFRQGLVSTHNLSELEATSVALGGYRETLQVLDRISELFFAASGINTPLLIAATGNESRRTSYTIAAAPPATANHVLGVAAVDKAGQVAYFSNTQPDVSGPGIDIWSARAGTKGLIAMSGTSMAAPHAAGVAALHAQRLVEEDAFSPKRLEQLITSNLKMLYGSFNDVGFGLVKA